MIDFRTEILKALPIPDFFTWWWNNWSGTGFHVWADELLEMEKEGIVKIELGRVELVDENTISGSQIYVHKENNPDRVYLSSESPQLKNWCKTQSDKLQKRDF